MNFRRISFADGCKDKIVTRMMCVCMINMKMIIELMGLKLKRRKMVLCSIMITSKPIETKRVWVRSFDPSITGTSIHRLFIIIGNFFGSIE